MIFSFVLGPPTPGGSRRRVRIAIFPRESLVLSRFRPGSWAKLIFYFNFVLKRSWVVCTFFALNCQADLIQAGDRALGRASGDDLALGPNECQCSENGFKVFSGGGPTRPRGSLGKAPAGAPLDLNRFSPRSTHSKAIPQGLLHSRVTELERKPV